MKRKFLFYLFICMVIFCFTASAGAGEIRWSDRVIPLPKEMVVTDIMRINAGNISYTIYTDQEDALPIKTMQTLLNRFAKGEGRSDELYISVVDLNKSPDKVSS